MTNITLGGWDIIEDASNSRLILKSTSTGNEYYLNENGNLEVPSGGGADLQKLLGALDANGQDVSNVGAFDATSVSTGKADITGESFVEPTRGSDNSSNTAATYVNAYDGESTDVNGEFNSSAQFNPNESGWFDINARVSFSANDGDDIFCQIRNVTDSTTVMEAQGRTMSGNNTVFSWFFIVNLTSGKNYEIQVRDQNSSFTVDASNTKGVIRRSVVHP